MRTVLFAKRSIVMKRLFTLLVVLSLVSVVVGCKAKVDSDGVSVQKTN